MTIRAAQIAKVLDDMIRAGVSVNNIVDIAKRDFKDELMSDVERAIEIVIEIQRADIAYIKHCYEQERGG